jgi:hypothetical protein
LSGKERASATGSIIEMRKAGLFDNPEIPGESGSALEERGLPWRVTSASGVVLVLLKKRELRGKKQDGKRVYGK